MSLMKGASKDVSKHVTVRLCFFVCSLEIAYACFWKLFISLICLSLNVPTYVGCGNYASSVLPTGEAPCILQKEKHQTCHCFIRRTWM